MKAPTSAFTFKTLLRHYAKQALTPRSLNVKLGPRRNYHKGRAAIRHTVTAIAASNLSYIVKSEVAETKMCRGGQLTLISWT